MKITKKLLAFVPDTVPEELRYGIKSINEEVANMLSHGVGLLFFIVASPMLVYKCMTNDISGDTFGALTFCCSAILVYTSSTLYHSVYKLRLKKRLRVFDHISIYFLIAGSFTPFLLKIDGSVNTVWVLKTQWILVGIGIIFKLFFTHKFKLVSTLAYVGMGALSFFVMDDLSKAIPSESYFYLKTGLVSYFVGVPFYLLTKIPYNHFIWHLFVLGGSISHFIAVWYLE